MEVIWKKEATSAKITHAHIFFTTPDPAGPQKIAVLDITLKLFNTDGDLIHTAHVDTLPDLSPAEIATLDSLIQSKLTACVNSLKKKEAE